MTVLSIFNRKGGTGKTATAVSLAAALAEAGKRTLLIDLDAQANATVSLGLRVSAGVAEVLMRERHIRDTLMPVNGALSVIPSSRRLSQIDPLLTEEKDVFSRLSEPIRSIKDRYEYVVIDCAPSMSIATLIGLCTTRYIIVPMTVDFLSNEGLLQVERTVATLIEKRGVVIEIAGLLLTMVRQHDPREKRFRSEAKQHVFKTAIRYDRSLAEAPSTGMAIMQSAPRSPGCHDYRAFAKELTALIARSTPNAKA